VGGMAVQVGAAGHRMHRRAYVLINNQAEGFI